MGIILKFKNLQDNVLSYKMIIGFIIFFNIHPGLTEKVTTQHNIFQNQFIYLREQFIIAHNQ